MFRVFFLLIFVCASSTGLKLTRMTVPSVADFRDDLSLDCRFDMGGEQLYALKWYKDDHEFFRFMPAKKPHVFAFEVLGVSIANDSVNCGMEKCSLVLTNLIKGKSGGVYKCEVSTEAPAFRLASERRNVTVAAVPKGDPVISGFEDVYNEGQILDAVCTTHPSDPPQTITWFINNEPVPSKYLRSLEHSSPTPENLVSTSQELRFVVVENHVKNHQITITCAAGFSGSEAMLFNAATKSTSSSNFSRKSVRKATVYQQGNAPSDSINNQRYFLHNGCGKCGKFLTGIFMNVVVILTVNIFAGFF